jgi:hypothetical protein
LLVRPKDISDVIQQGCGVFLGRYCQELPVVLANVFSEKVDALFDGCDMGLLSRELKPARFEKPFHQGFDLLFPYLRSATGDDAIIGPPHQVDSPGLSLSGGQMLSLEQSFQAV